MYWQADDNDEQFIVSDEVIDLAFTIQCRSLPIDHAWQLSVAVKAHLPWLGTEPGSALHLIHGAESGNGWERPDDPKELLYLSRRTPLVIRAPKHREADVATLIGKTLTVHDTDMTIGKYKSRLLSSSDSLYARHVAMEPDMDEEALVEQTVKMIRSHGIGFKKIVVGKSTRLQTPDGSLNVASLLVADLTKSDSVRLQQLGVGKHQAMGCGLFIAHKTV